MSKNITVNIQEGKSFYADEISITNNPLRVILDFKTTTPRIDVRTNQGQVPLVCEHNVIQLDCHLAKHFHKLLGEHLEQYEKQYGEITEPKQLTQAKQEQHPVTQTKPEYFG